MKKIKILILDDEINPVSQLTSSIINLMPKALFEKAKEGLTPMVNEWNQKRRDSVDTSWSIDSIMQQLIKCTLIHDEFRNSFKPSEFPETHSAIINFLEKLPIEIKVFSDVRRVLDCGEQPLSGEIADNTKSYDIVIADWKLEEYDPEHPYGLMGNRILLYAHHRKALVGFYSAFKPEMLRDPDNMVVYEILKPDMVEISKTELWEGVYELYLKFLKRRIESLSYEDMLKIDDAIDDIILDTKENNIEEAQGKEISIGKERFSFYHLFPFLTWTAETKSPGVEYHRKDLTMILERAKRETATGMLRMLYDNSKIKSFLHDPSKKETEDITDLVKEITQLKLARCKKSNIQELDVKHRVHLDLKCKIYDVFKNQSGELFDYSKVRGIRKLFRIIWDDKRRGKDGGYSYIDGIIKEIITGIDIQRENEMQTPSYFSYFFYDVFYNGMKGLIGEIKTHGGGVKSVALEFTNKNSVVVNIEQEKANLSGIKNAQSNLKLSIEQLNLFCSVKASGKFGSSQRIWNCGGYFEEGKDSPGLWILTFQVFRAEEE